MFLLKGIQIWKICTTFLLIFNSCHILILWFENCMQHSMVIAFGHLHNKNKRWKSSKFMSVHKDDYTEINRLKTVVLLIKQSVSLKYLPSRLDNISDRKIGWGYFFFGLCLLDGISHSKNSIKFSSIIHLSLHEYFPLKKFN